MRNTFSLIRDSFLQFVKKSTDTTDSSNQEDTDAQANFYREFIQGGHSLHCQIKRVERVPRAFFQRSYAVYVVEVTTQIVQFEVKKRYREFEQFYEQCMGRGNINTSFPPRTIFQPGWTEDVTTERHLQLNFLLQQVTASSNTGLQLQLFSFLRLYHHCRQMKLSAKQSPAAIADEYLLLELAKLNENHANMLEGLQRIQLSLADRKKRIGYELARQLLTGGEEYQGLLSIVLSSGNELVVTQGLQLLNWLVSAETNRDCDAFRRVLAKCLPVKLVLEYEEVRTHCEVGSQYFKLLKHYLDGRQEGDLHQVALCYSNRTHFEQQYLRWLKYNSMDSA